MDGWTLIKSPKTITLAEEMIEISSSMLHEIASTTEHKEKDGDQ